MKNFSKDSSKKFNLKSNVKRKSSFIKADLYIAKDTPDNIAKEIFEVLSNANFEKLSCPLYTYKYMIDSNDSNQVYDGTTVAGFIRSFIPNKAQFNVTIFNNLIDIISTWENPMIEVVFTTKKDKDTNEDTLGTIIKLNIVRTENSDDCIEINTDNTDIEEFVSEEIEDEVMTEENNN